MHLPKILAFAAVAIVALAACGGSTTTGTAGPNATPATVGSTTSPTTAPTQAAPTQDALVTPAPVGGAVDVCSLLTLPELRAATGKDYLAGTSYVADLSDCNWATAEGDQISAYLLANPFGFNFHKDNTPAGGLDLTVSGHPAFYNLFASNALSSVLWVDLGDGREFSVWYTETQAIATQLAETALSKL